MYNKKKYTRSIWSGFFLPSYHSWKTWAFPAVLGPQKVNIFRCFWLSLCSLFLSSFAFPSCFPSLILSPFSLLPCHTYIRTIADTFCLLQTPSISHQKQNGNSPFTFGKSVDHWFQCILGTTFICKSKLK